MRTRRGMRRLSAMRRHFSTEAAPIVSTTLNTTSIFCALHFALEEVAMRTREDGISDAVSDMGIIWFWVIKVHEISEVG